jgi:deoxyxylulose-5-phosphate synthase
MAVGLAEASAEPLLAAMSAAVRQVAALAEDTRAPDHRAVDIVVAVATPVEEAASLAEVAVAPPVVVEAVAVTTDSILIWVP